MSGAEPIIYAELRRDCDRAARNVAGALMLGAQHVDDLSQEAAARVIAYCTSSPDLEQILEHPGRRSELVAKVTRVIGYEILRRRDVAQRHHKSKGYDAARNAGGAEPDPLNEAARAEESGTLLHLTSIIPAEGAARLAYDVAEKRITLQQYAAEKNVSLRTAQRHYLLGVEELRKLLRHATGG